MLTILALPDLAATQRLGAKIAAALQRRDVVTLEGDLGVGKTELARAILRSAADDAELTVPSPTFTLVETYDTPAGSTIWHFDLYRLAAPEDAWELGLEEALVEGISLIEWPENLGHLLPGSRLNIRLEADAPDGQRTATISTHGDWRDRLSTAVLA